VKWSDFEQLEIECEVAIRLSKDLTRPDQPYSIEEVLQAVFEVMIAYELVDRRPFEGERSLLQSISMNVIGAGVVLGPPVADWQDLDLANAGCSLEINSSSAGTGKGSDVNGHPILPLHWLANALQARGAGLSAGDIVITGSMIPPMPLAQGDQARLTMDLLGSVELTVT
jgi:2-oxo-3-hexenedioate decarboxylase/2-keto-4-pentenoate hydratase